MIRSGNLGKSSAKTGSISLPNVSSKMKFDLHGQRCNWFWCGGGGGGGGGGVERSLQIESSMSLPNQDGSVNVTIVIGSGVSNK